MSDLSVCIICEYLCLTRTSLFDADSLTERLQNAMNSVFQLTTQRDSRASLAIADINNELAWQGRNNNTAMMTIAFISLLFLPGTFVASFFQTPIFNFPSPPDGDGKVIVARPFWIYWTVSGLLTLVLGAGWMKYLRRRREMDIQEREFERTQFRERIRRRGGGVAAFVLERRTRNRTGRRGGGGGGGRGNGCGDGGGGGGGNGDVVHLAKTSETGSGTRTNGYGDRRRMTMMQECGLFSGRRINRDTNGNGNNNKTGRWKRGASGRASDLEVNGGGVGGHGMMSWMGSEDQSRTRTPTRTNTNTNTGIAAATYAGEYIADEIKMYSTSSTRTW